MSADTARITKKPEDGKDRKKGHKARFLTRLFENQPRAKLSDAKLAAECKKEYPNVKSDWESRMSAFRRIYNKGHFFGQKKKPTVPAVRYDNDGKIMFPTPPGRKPGVKLKKNAADKKPEARTTAPAQTTAAKPVTVKKS
jgi:hypothetical protein